MTSECLRYLEEPCSNVLEIRPLYHDACISISDEGSYSGV